MAAKSLLNQLTKIACINVFKYNGSTAPNELTKATRLLTATKSVYCNNVNLYCSVVNNIPIVSYEDIKQLRKSPEILLIDVREPQELQETGKIPTSINIPLGQVATELGPNVSKDAFKAKYGRNKPERNTEIIFHCRIGKRSQNAAELARTLGYQNTKNYLGSWAEWAEKGGFRK